jgi:hypothetical protein
MASMSKRERVLRTVAHQETDRVPIYDILQNDTLIEHLAGETLTVAKGDSVKARAIRACLDMTRMPAGPSEPRVQRREDGLVVQHERWTSWIIQRPWHDRASLLAWVRQEIARAEGQRFDAAFATQFHQRLAYFQGLIGDDTVLVVESGVGLTEIYWALGWEEFAYLLADEPALILEWLEARHQAELRRVAAIADPRLIPIALTYDDIAYKNTTLLAPRWLRQHWVPRLAALNATWHGRGVLCLFHSDGNLWPVLDDLVAAGIDGLNPLETIAGMTVAEVRARHPQLFLTGGVDVSQLLPFGTPQEVRAVCRANIAAAEGRGYFLGSTTELMWDLPLENILAMFSSA